MLNKIRNQKKKITVFFLTALCCIMSVCAAAFADTTGTANSAVTTAMTQVAADMVATINAMIPIALTVVGIILVVMAGIRAFKKLAKPS